ncbi:hypothetical protein [Acetobacter lambici]|uniref:hypothetical protein n=1 Tax=Acetobacter lambici TaxID=1332824 RepID=UPI0038D0C95E
MTADDIIAGKGGFQKADLMDYGSLYGMGSYYGEDYTASLLKILRFQHGKIMHTMSERGPFPICLRKSRRLRQPICVRIFVASI